MQYYSYEDITTGLTQVSRFYTHCLLNSSEPLQYCVGRGLSTEILEGFGIGYAPGIEKLSQFLKMNDIPEKMLEASGNFRFAEDPYDKFTGRVVFPIHDLNGSVAAFSARWIYSDLANTAKYLNSPSSQAFKKSLFLYGLYYALPSIAELKYALVVEGNVDVLSLSQAGFTNVVAPCGTALTLSQIHILRNFARIVVTCFDSDPAGIRASVRAKELCNVAGCVWYNLPLSEYKVKDPDEFIQTHGWEKFQELIQGYVQ